MLLTMIRQYKEELTMNFIGLTPKFHRYEDASLEYTGLNRHASDTRIGLMDSTVPIEAMLEHWLVPKKYNIGSLLYTLHTVIQPIFVFS